MKDRKRLGLLIVCGLALDLGTKFVVERQLPRPHWIVLIPDIFALHYAENRGAAWSLGANWHSGLRLTFFLTTGFVAVAVVAWALTRIAQSHVWLRIGLALVIAGALGNTIDRVRQPP